MDLQSVFTEENLTWLQELIVQWGANLGGALLLIVVGWIGGKWIHKALSRMVERSTWIDTTLKPLIATVAQYTFLVVVGVAVLAQFGIQTTSIIAVLGAAGLAIGLALQGTLSNIAAGFMLLVLRPMRVGEYIDAEGLAGTVEEIGIFTTRLKTFDGVYLSVPNAQLWNRSIKNFTRNPSRRVDVQVAVAYGDDVEGALAVLNGILASDERVMADPPPQVMVMALADSGVTLNMRCWTTTAEYWNLLFELNKRAKLELEAKGYTIPFPQRVVHMVPVGGNG